MFSTQTYDIADTIKYFDTTFTSTQIISLPDTIQVNFKCIYKTTDYTSTTNGGAWVEIGSDSNNLILFGETSSDSKLGIFVKVSGTNVVVQQGESILVNSDVEHEYSYNNGSQSVSANNKTVTFSNSQITGRTYGRIFIQGGRKIKDLMFLPL